MRPAYRPGGRVAFLVMAAVCALVLSGVLGGQGGETLRIEGVTVVDVEAERLMPDMTVAIADGRIVDVRSGSDDGAPALGVELVDGRGRFLIPGLWDAHVHLSYARVSALPALVANGVTAVRDLGSTLSEIDRWRDQIEAGDLVGPHIARAGPMLNGQVFNAFQREVTTADDARRAVRELHAAGVDFLKTHRRTPREAYFALADEARQLGLSVVGHIPMTVEPAEAAEAGQATIEHTETLFEGTFTTPVTQQDMAGAIERWRAAEAGPVLQLFAEHGAAVTPTLTPWREIITRLEGAPPDPRERYVSESSGAIAEEALGLLAPRAAEFARRQRRLLREYQAIVRLLGEHGVRVLAGTDLAAGYVYPGFSLHDELGLLVESGLTSGEALRAATVNVARLFPDLDAGEVRAGRRADLVLLDANPLDAIGNTRRIRAVVLNGRLLDRAELDALLEDAARLARLH